MKSKVSILYGVIGVFGTAAAILPLAVYHLIETAGSSGMSGMHGMAMACEKTCTAMTVIGAVIAVIAIVSLFLKNTKLSIGSSALLLVGGVAEIIAPKAIGLCKSSDMACNYLTAPTLAILGSLIIVLSVVRLISSAVVLRKVFTAA
jgi:hypothetical protein